MDAKKIRRFGSTLAALRPIQLMYLPVRRLQQQLRAWFPAYSSWFYRRTAAFEKARPASLGILAERVVSILRPSASPLVSKGRIRVLNNDVELTSVDWERHLRPRLWAFHLHYFHGAPALALAASRGDRIASETLTAWLRIWIERCRVARGPGWDPFPISQRLVNWIWVDLIAGQAIDPAVVALMRSSAVQQADYLSDHLEYHLMANHLLKNAKALFLASLIWGKERRGSRWYRRAASVLQREVEEQVLPDGGHFERSLMYHDAVLQDLLEVALLARAVGASHPVSVDVLRRMATFRMTMMHPDGTRARFNDVIEELVPAAEQIGSLYQLHDPQWKWSEPARVELRQSGYYGYRDRRAGECFLINGGEPGPRYQPAHAHCDLLSFELSLFGRRWIVDPGSAGYADDPFRDYARSTRAHNTLSIDGREQSEIWGVFRMGRRAQLAWARCSGVAGGGWSFDGAYRPHSRCGILHQRRATRLNNGIWQIRDRVEGGDGASVEGALHFHPEVRVDLEGDRLICQRNGRQVLVVWSQVAEVTLTRGERNPSSGWFFPAYGIAQPTVTVRYRQGVQGGFDIIPTT